MSLICNLCFGTHHKGVTLWCGGDRHTSKKPEKGEVEGVHFFFVKKEVMQKMADGGQLVEWSEGPGGSLTGTAATSLHQVCTCMRLPAHHVVETLPWEKS